MILEARNVSYFYQSQRDKLILDNVSCGFECGRLYAILGPSGAGKTTLLSLLAGLDTPVQGEIRYDGIPVTPKDLARHRRSHISLVFQSYNLIDYLTPLENVRPPTLFDWIHVQSQLKAKAKIMMIKIMLIIKKIFINYLPLYKNFYSTMIVHYYLLR